MDIKRCSKCEKELPLSSFPPDARYSMGVHCWCRECRNLHARRQDGQMRRKNTLRSKFNKTLEWYSSKLEEQGGGCAICGSAETRPARQRTDTSGGMKVRALAIDHDRSCCSGQRSCGECVRGILCGHCNTGIGKLRDDIALLESAIAYLKAYKKVDSQ